MNKYRQNPSETGLFKMSTKIENKLMNATKLNSNFGAGKFRCRSMSNSTRETLNKVRRSVSRSSQEPMDL